MGFRSPFRPFITRSIFILTSCQNRHRTHFTNFSLFYRGDIVSNHTSSSILNRPLKQDLSVCVVTSLSASYPD
nr:MAG TPA: YoaP-like protein [Caudoviricetes sp.]